MGASSRSRDHAWNMRLPNVIPTAIVSGAEIRHIDSCREPPCQRGDFDNRRPTAILKRRQLAPPRAMTGKERRRMNPNRGLIKLCERYADITISRFVYPLLGKVWNPYSWQLEQRFELAETTLCPAGWPAGVA